MFVLYDNIIPHAHAAHGRSTHIYAYIVVYMCYLDYTQYVYLHACAQMQTTSTIIIHISHIIIITLDDVCVCRVMHTHTLLHVRITYTHVHRTCICMRIYTASSRHLFNLCNMHCYILHINIGTYHRIRGLNIYEAYVRMYAK